MEAFAGCRKFELTDQMTGDPIPGLILYPTEAPERVETFGPYTFNVAMDAPAMEGTFPLVVISHGTGGSHLLYRGTAEHLARRGFVVALPEHPRNNRNNNELAGTAEILANRPRHLRVVIDWAVALGWVSASSVAVIGHSLGGYTALALAGGYPTAFARETAEGSPREVVVTADDRVKALVLLAPATPWFMAPGALSRVRVPILMMTGERDPHTPAFHGEIVKRGVADPALVEHREVANAGHFSFQTPFPAAMIHPSFPPSQDPDGFDRPSFQAQMNAEVLAFLHRVI